MDLDTDTQMHQAAVSLPWRLVNASGAQQTAACTGTGEPTVVYIDGWGSPAGPGLGRWPQPSSRAPTASAGSTAPASGCPPPRRGTARHSTPEQQAEEMLAMLSILGKPGFYLLVPWSYGGLVARAAGTTHPELVAGVVLVDASSPLQSGMDEPWQGEKGIVDTDTIATSVGDGQDMGTRPVIVSPAGQNEGWASTIATQRAAPTMLWANDSSRD